MPHAKFYVKCPKCEVVNTDYMWDKATKAHEGNDVMSIFLARGLSSLDVYYFICPACNRISDGEDLEITWISYGRRSSIQQ